MTVAQVSPIVSGVSGLDGEARLPLRISYCRAASASAMRWILRSS